MFESVLSRLFYKAIKHVVKNTFKNHNDLSNLSPFNASLLLICWQQTLRVRPVQRCLILFKTDNVAALVSVTNVLLKIN